MGGLRQLLARFPPEMRLATKRIERDDAKIAELEKAVVEFLAEVDAKVAGLRRLYGLPEPCPQRRPRSRSAKSASGPTCPRRARSCSRARTSASALPRRAGAGVPHRHEADAQEAVKFLCSVERKRDITPGSPAFAKWTEIWGTFRPSAIMGARSMTPALPDVLAELNEIADGLHDWGMRPLAARLRVVAAQIEPILKPSSSVDYRVSRGL
jgi:hypothetical protein